MMDIAFPFSWGELKEKRLKSGLGKMVFRTLHDVVNEAQYLPSFPGVFLFSRKQDVHKVALVPCTKRAASAKADDRRTIL
jgi:hypothetical protein